MADAPDGPVTIFHNPRCSKSRQALALLEEQGDPVVVVEYLKAPPDRRTLEDLLSRLSTPPSDLVRTGDPAFRALGVDAGSLTTGAAVVDLLVDHPEVMQRPVVVRGDRAVIARPPELIDRLG